MEHPNSLFIKGLNLVHKTLKAYPDDLKSIQKASVCRKCLAEVLVTTNIEEKEQMRILILTCRKVTLMLEQIEAVNEVFNVGTKRYSKTPKPLTPPKLFKGL